MNHAANCYHVDCDEDDYELHGCDTACDCLAPAFKIGTCVEYFQNDWYTGRTRKVNNGVVERITPKRLLVRNQYGNLKTFKLDGTTVAKNEGGREPAGFLKVRD